MFITLLSVTSITGYIGLTFLSKPIFITGSAGDIQVDRSKPRVLLICLAGGIGGAEIHTLGFHKMLKQHGYATPILVPTHSKLDRHLTQHQVPHYTTHINKLMPIRPLYHLLLKWCLSDLCKKENISIIQCNNRSEVMAALSTKKHCATNVVFTRHVQDHFAIHKIKGVDAIIGVSPYITHYLESENFMQNSDISIVRYIPPFFDADPFCSYTPTNSRQDFFKNSFDINIKPYPVITMIANFHRVLLTKNHPLLFDAVKILVQKNKPVQVMLAGDGPSQEQIRSLAKEPCLEPYIHFLGFTNKTPDLLYHSDIFVLSSSNEAFGIVYLEAGLMKKPSIGATETGAPYIILPEKTGLLFKNGNAQDLANQIERLIDNPEWGQELGKNAHEHIKQNFLPEATFAQYEELYKQLETIK